MNALYVDCFCGRSLLVKHALCLGSGGQLYELSASWFLWHLYIVCTYIRPSDHFLF